MTFGSICCAYIPVFEIFINIHNEVEKSILQMKLKFCYECPLNIGDELKCRYGANDQRYLSGASRRARRL
jgi:hypothetical protein